MHQISQYALCYCNLSYQRLTTGSGINVLVLLLVFLHLRGRRFARLLLYASAAAGRSLAFAGPPGAPNSDGARLARLREEVPLARCRPEPTAKN